MNYVVVNARGQFLNLATSTFVDKIDEASFFTSGYRASRTAQQCADHHNDTMRVYGEPATSVDDLIAVVDPRTDGGAAQNPFRRFPVLNAPKGCPSSVAWSMIGPHEKQARLNRDSDLERLFERGGLCASEMVAVLEDRRWHHMSDADAAARLRQLVAEAFPIPKLEPKLALPGQVWAPPGAASGVLLIATDIPCHWAAGADRCDGGHNYVDDKAGNRYCPAEIAKLWTRVADQHWHIDPVSGNDTK